MKYFFLTFISALTCSFTSGQELTYQSFDFPAIEKVNTDSVGSPDTKAIVMYEKRGIEYAYNKESQLEKYYFLYRKVFIKNDPGIEENNRIYIIANDLSDILLFKSRTINANKEVVSKQEKSDLKKDEDKEAGSYYKCAVEGVKTNMVVEYFYLTKAIVNLRGTEYLQTKQQKQKIDFEIISPTNLVFEAKVYNCDASFKKSADTTKNIISCTMKNMAEKGTEEYSAATANLVRVEYKFAYNYAEDKSRKYTWESAGLMFYKILHENLTSSKAVRKIIKENKLADKTTIDKVYFFEQYVKTNIAANDDSPFVTADDIMKNKIGSKINILRLYLTYFREVGVNYEIYMVSNRLENPLDKSFDTWNFLSSFILYFPDLDKYLDPDNYGLRLGQITFTAAGTDALNIKEVVIGSVAKGLSVIKQLPFSSYEKNVDVLVSDISFNKDLSGVKIHDARKISGYPSDNIRPFYYYSSSDKREEFMKDYLRQEDQNVSISNVQVNNFDFAENLESKPFEVNYDVTNKIILEHAGDKMLFKVGEIIGRQAELYQDKKRTTDIDIAYPHQYLRTINITIPQGYKISNLNAAKINISFADDKGKDIMSFVSSVSQKENVVTVNIDEHYGFTSLSKNRFDDFKKVINAAADFNKVVFVLDPVK